MIESTPGPFCGHDGRQCCRQDRSCLTAGRCLGQTVVDANADAWLYTCRKPGKVAAYASVDPDDRQWQHDGEKWEKVTKEPLYAAPPGWVTMMDAMGEAPINIMRAALVNIASISPLSTASPQEIAKTALVASGVLKAHQDAEADSR